MTDVDHPSDHLHQKGVIGYPLRRLAHLHSNISACDFEMISTHIYDSRDLHLAQGAMFGFKPELIGTFRPDNS